ncbi:MAG: thioredoxin family protein [Planctomycetota bacterium]
MAATVGVRWGWYGKSVFSAEILAAIILAGWLGPAVFAEAPADLASQQHLITEMRPLASSITPAIAWHEDLNSGWAASKRTGRPMLIFITTEPCRFCDAMKRNTLCNQTVAQRLAARFVPIRLQRAKHASVLSRIAVKTYPTTLVALPKGKVVDYREGYQPPAEFTALLNTADTPNDDELARH